MFVDFLTETDAWYVPNIATDEEERAASEEWIKSGGAEKAWEEYQKYLKSLSRDPEEKSAKSTSK